MIGSEVTVVCEPSISKQLGLASERSWNWRLCSDNRKGS